MIRAGLSAMAAALALMLSACSSAPAADAVPTPTVSADIPTASVSLLETGDMFTNRDGRAEYDADGTVLSFGDSISCSNPELVSIESNTVTLKGEGTYILRGVLTNGSIIIDAADTDKLQLVLDGVDIYSMDFAAIYVKQADKVFITLSENSENRLSNGGEFKSTDESNVDAVVYSKDDISFNGSGTLTISSPGGNGISGKDDLVITGGRYTVTALGHALEASDSVRISGGDFELSSGKDGIHSEHDSDSALGYVYLSGGNFSISSDGDAISSGGSMQIDGGSFNLISGGGSDTVIRSGDDFRWNRQPASAENSVSAKGLKSSASIAVNDGQFIIDSADDCIHAAQDIYISDGTMNLSSGDDAVHAGNTLLISGGETNIPKSYEGLEGMNVTLSGGNVSIRADDDGVNAAGGRDNSGREGFKGFSGNPGFSGSSDCAISITGGTLSISADGDGLDSNGSLSVSGGEIFIEGPLSDGNSALDYEISADISGGTFIALSSAGMAQNFSTAAQGVMLISPGMQKAGSELSLTDSSGNTLLKFSAAKDFASVIISCPSLTQGESFTFSVGNYSSTVKLESLIYSEGGASGFGIRPAEGSDMPRGGGHDFANRMPPSGANDAPRASK